MQGSLTPTLAEANKPDVNKPDELGFMPIHAASCLDVYKVGEGVAAATVRALLKAGAEAR